MRSFTHTTSITGTLWIILLVVAGCAADRSAVSDREAVELAQIEELRSHDALLPFAPDSILLLYRRYEPQAFSRAFHRQIETVRDLVDSLNRGLDPGHTIDTLAIDHTLENFGAAARTGRTIFLSSSYFFVFDDPAVVRGAVVHEFGHLYFERLPPEDHSEVKEIWTAMRASALFYLFRDGEYSGNARFGGHPGDSPEELFASAFNLFGNRPEEVEARLRYVDPHHLPLVRRLQRIVGSAAPAPPSSSPR